MVQQFLVIKSNKHQRRLIVSTVSETQQKQTKSILQARLTEPQERILGWPAYPLPRLDQKVFSRLAEYDDFI